MDSYLRMMRRMTQLYGVHKAQMCDVPADTDSFAAFIEALDEKKFQRMMTGVGTLFGGAGGCVFGREFSLADLQRLAETEDDRWTRVMKVAQSMPPQLDLTDSVQKKLTFETAELLLSLYPSAEDLHGVDLRIVTEQQKYPTVLHLASKLALSKQYVDALVSPIHVTVVAAMYKEHNRIVRKAEHPAGEDFVRRKVAQLEWLFGSKTGKTWDLLFVDDGCPEKSGEIATSIIEEEGYNNVRVLFLADGIADGSPATKGLNSTDDSQKGGAIQYGMWVAIHETHGDAEHVVAYTDADLSTNIAQTGLLLGALADEDTSCAIGSRYDPGGIYCTPTGAQGLTEYDRVMLVFRHFVRSKLLPQLGGVIDTQCGFKAFKAEGLNKVLEQMTDKGFSFDMELLLLTTLQSSCGRSAVGKAPIVWVESNEESNFYSA